MSIIDLATELYNKGTPIFTDAEFDYIEDKLGNLKVGCKEGNINHPSRLYSLAKFYDSSKAPIYKEAVKTPKLDGQAISLVYEFGRLTLAATRGDGFQGRDVTEFLSYKVPNELICKTPIQIIGELVAPKHIENARNYAAGASNLKDIEEALERETYFVAYEIRGLNNSFYLEDLQTLKGLGFVVVNDLSQLPELPTDGIVVRTNSNLEYSALGFTSKHPRGAYALKDASSVPVEETILLAVKWDIGSSGKVTPVAYFEEVDIDGAKVSKATLHNQRFIRELDLDIGDTILVTRSGGVIPKVIGKV